MIFVLTSCKNGTSKKQADSESNNYKVATSYYNLEQKLQLLEDSDSDRVMIIAHRGDWRHAPENSLQAIKNCIDMGIDMVEIDVRLTKDSIPVLMHDKTIDRTTTGKGKLNEWTLDSLKTLYLKNGANHETHHKIPTLQEALTLARGKILINLDKCFDYFDIIFPILEETNTTHQVLMKGNVSVKQVNEDFNRYLDKVMFMPVINLDKEDAIQKTNEYLNSFNPVAFEFVFSDVKSPLITKFDSIQKLGSRIWVNSLWETLNAGYEDDKAITNTDSIYGWYIQNHINMIQTDRPRLLLEYLRKKEPQN